MPYQTHRAKPVVRIAIAIVVVEVEQSGIRSIVVVTSTFEHRVVRVHEVGVHFTVYNLFHQHDETKNNLGKELFELISSKKKSSEIDEEFTNKVIELIINGANLEYKDEKKYREQIFHLVDATL